jgi:hypothetical protein
VSYSLSALIRIPYSETVVFCIKERKKYSYNTSKEKPELISQDATYPLADVKAEHLLRPEAGLEKEA